MRGARLLSAWVLLFGGFVACSGEVNDSLPPDGTAGAGKGGGAGTPAATGGTGGSSAGRGGSGAAGVSAASGSGTTAGRGGQGGAAAGKGGGTAAGGAGTAGKSGAGTGGTSDGGSSGEGGGAVPTDGWLHTAGNRILTSDGKPFHGRGANLHDTRSCDACSTMPPNPEGLKRWADELIDGWHANFIRFNLWAFEDDGGFRVQWKSFVDDPEYAADIRDVVNYMTSKPDVYVMVTVFLDPTQVPDGELHGTWPTEDTLPLYAALADTFAENPRVLFGLMNEPHDEEDQNPALADIFSQAIDTIRGVEQARGTPEHIVVAQGTQLWARDAWYWIDNPLGPNVAYEVHAYNPPEDFEWIVVEPAQSIPLLIGEFGYSDYQTIEEAKELMQVAEDNEVPWIAWNFHQRCPPNLLDDKGGSGYDGCGFEGAGTSYTWPTTDWGNAVKERLAIPW